MDMEVVPILNKIDLPQADPLRVAEEIEDIVGIDDQLVEIQKPNLVYLLRLATILLDRGEGVSALEAAPLYVREEVAQKPLS